MNFLDHIKQIKEKKEDYKEASEICKKMGFNGLFGEDACNYSLIIQKSKSNGYSCVFRKAGSSLASGAIANVIANTPELGIKKIEEYLLESKFQNKKEFDITSNDHTSNEPTELGNHLQNNDQLLVIRRNMYRDRYKPLSSAKSEICMFKTSYQTSSEEFIKNIDFNEILSEQTVNDNSFNDTSSNEMN